MAKYDEVGSLADALAELGICKNSQGELRTRLVREACDALGMIPISTMAYQTTRSKYSKTEAGNIVKWLIGKYAPVKALPQYADKYAYKTIGFNTDKTTRHVIKLEAYYIDALKQIGVDDISSFLSRVTSKEWHETSGDKSIIKIVKCAIVQALLNRKVGKREASQ